MPSEQISITILVVDAFESLKIPYLIGGSLASSLHGVMRATMDVDILADIKIEQVAPFISILKDQFYADSEMITSAIVHKSSFNLVHFESLFKADVFLSKGSEFERSQLKRRQGLTISDESDRKVYFATVEDTLLAKLDWYRQGGKVSERQWQDVLGMIKVQKDHLDLAYLNRWATDLGIQKLLDVALLEA